jgi:hypothetical protein
VQFLHRTHPQWRLTLAPSTLMRLRNTESQAGLTPRQRRLNVRGAFSVSDSSQVSGQHILVVDDILTTGATARAAAQTLLKAGAASVWVATLARAQRSVPFGRHFDFAGEEDGSPSDNEPPDYGLPGFELKDSRGPFGEAIHAADLNPDSSIELEQTSF